MQASRASLGRSDKRTSVSKMVEFMKKSSSSVAEVPKQTKPQARPGRKLEEETANCLGDQDEARRSRKRFKATHDRTNFLSRKLMRQQPQASRPVKSSSRGIKLLCVVQYPKHLHPSLHSLSQLRHHRSSASFSGLPSLAHLHLFIPLNHDTCTSRSRLKGKHHEGSNSVDIELKEARARQQALAAECGSNGHQRAPTGRMRVRISSGSARRWRRSLVSWSMILRHGSVGLPGSGAARWRAEEDHRIACAWFVSKRHQGSFLITSQSQSWFCFSLSQVLFDLRP